METELEQDNTTSTASKNKSRKDSDKDQNLINYQKYLKKEKEKEIKEEVKEDLESVDNLEPVRGGIFAKIGGVLKQARGILKRNNRGRRNLKKEPQRVNAQESNYHKKVIKKTPKTRIILKKQEEKWNKYQEKLKNLPKAEEQKIPRTEEQEKALMNGLKQILKKEEKLLNEFNNTDEDRNEANDQYRGLPLKEVLDRLMIEESNLIKSLNDNQISINDNQMISINDYGTTKTKLLDKKKGNRRDIEQAKLNFKNEVGKHRYPQQAHGPTLRANLKIADSEKNIKDVDKKLKDLEINKMSFKKEQEINENRLKEVEEYISDIKEVLNSAELHWGRRFESHKKEIKAAEKGNRKLTSITTEQRKHIDTTLLTKTDQDEVDTAEIKTTRKDSEVEGKGQQVYTDKQKTNELPASTIKKPKAKIGKGSKKSNKTVPPNMIRGIVGAKSVDKKDDNRSVSKSDGSIRGGLSTIYDTNKGILVELSRVPVKKIADDTNKKIAEKEKEKMKDKAIWAKAAERKAKAAAARRAKAEGEKAPKQTATIRM